MIAFGGTRAWKICLGIAASPETVGLYRPLISTIFRKRKGIPDTVAWPYDILNNIESIPTIVVMLILRDTYSHRTWSCRNGQGGGLGVQVTKDGGRPVS